MIKKAVFVAVGGLVLAGLFFGRDAFSYLTTTVGRMHESVRNSVPVEFEIARARDLLSDLEPEIRHNMRRIAREEVEVARLEREVARHERELAQEKRDILRLKQDLETESAAYVYAGRTYSEEQVQRDLANRFQHYKTHQATLEQLQKILTARRATLRAAQQKLEAMLAAKRQLEVEVENLVARAKMIEVAQTTSEFQFDDSRLARTKELIQDIRTRLEVDEKLLNTQVNLHDRIPLEKEDEVSGEGIVEAVDRYFGEDQAELAVTARHQ